MAGGKAPSVASKIAPGEDYYTIYLNKMASISRILSGDYDLCMLGKDVHQANRQVARCKETGDLSKELRLQRAVSFANMAKEVVSKLPSLSKDQLKASLLALKPLVKEWPVAFEQELWSQFFHRVSATTIQTVIHHGDHIMDVTPLWKVCLWSMSPVELEVDSSRPDELPFGHVLQRCREPTFIERYEQRLCDSLLIPLTLEGVKQQPSKNAVASLKHISDAMDVWLSSVDAGTWACS